MGEPIARPRLHGSRSDLRTKLALESFDRGRYDEVVDLVGSVGDEEDERSPHPTFWHQIRDVVEWICRARSEDKADAALHREALARIEHRQEELKHTLGVVFDLLGNTATVPTADARPPRRDRAARDRSSAPALEVYCLGTFHVYFAERLVENWTSGRGKAILKFLASSGEHRAGKEVLMELLWPEAEPHAARNSLNVAIYGLRQALATIDPFSVVLFRDDSYLLNPALELWVDHEEFTGHVMTAQALERHGDIEGALGEYRRAEPLYRGEFFADDRYDDWPDLQRRSLRDRYVTVLDHVGRDAFDRGDYAACIETYRKMNAVDPCDEEPHRRLMVCWSRLGLAHLAHQQYLECRDTLERQLASTPSASTVELLDRIQRGEPM